MMIKQKAQNNRLLIFVAIIILIGVAVVVIALQRSTNYQQHASSFNDLNSAQDITATNNPDGTMGGVDYTTNFSNTLPPEFLGTVDLQVIDPPQAKPTDVGNQNPGKPVGAGNPHDLTGTPTMFPTQTLPTQAQGNGNNGNNGQGNSNGQDNNGNGNNNQPSTTSGSANSNIGGEPQAVKSLVLTINKVEVHLAHLATPGQKVEITATPTNIPTPGKPTTSPMPKTNQDVNKWEVLNIGGTQTVDLVQLAISKNFASLGLTKLAGGLYTEVRLYVSKATATLADGTTTTLTIPGRANIVRIAEPFTVVSGKTTTLIMDFDAQNSVIKAGDQYFLKPVVAHFDQQNQP